jgi:hypothetical protein
VHSSILAEISPFFRVFPRWCGLGTIKTAKKDEKTRGALVNPKKNLEPPKKV